MRRLLALLFVAFALAPGTWLRTPKAEPVDELALRFVPLALGGFDSGGGTLGPFAVKGVWRIDSRYRGFGSYSALIALGDGTLMAFSDNGAMLSFSPPGARPSKPMAKALFRAHGPEKYGRDVEAATFEPDAQTVWLGLEFRNAVSRYTLRDGLPVFDATVRPAVMAGWGANSGPESLERLHDGRFLALREGFSTFSDRRRHRAAVFASDPIEEPEGTPFSFLGPSGFSPTDAAQLPDGRVLVLMRRLVWPFPARFAGAIAIGDPAAIRKGRDWPVAVLAKWGSSAPVDNFEGMAIEPAEQGRVTIWLISDDNFAAFQHTILVKLSLDPARVSRSRKKTRGSPARLAN